MAKVFKTCLVFLFLFGLAHADWIPMKLNVDPEDVPMGVLNMVLLLGLSLWLSGVLSGGQSRNPIRPYNWFVGIVILWFLVAATTGYERDFLVTLRTGKTQVAMLLVYFLPLALIKDESDFKLFFGASLLVHLLIGLEVMRSGVLGGVNFHDMKRGSGPFGADWRGADVAASYLAQTLMLYAGGVLVFFRRPLVATLFAGAGGILLVGLYATYARGALLGAIIGAFLLVFAKKFSWRIVVAIAVLVAAGVALMPEAAKTRIKGTVQEGGAFDESSQGRMYYYQVALEIAKNNPFGVGTAQIRSAMMKYTGGGNMGGDGKYVDPHNSFLQILCEQSLLGLIVFLAFLWQLGKEALRGAKVSSDNALSYSSYCIGMIGFIGAFIVCNMFYANFHKELVMGMVSWHFGMLGVVERVRLTEKMTRTVEMD